MADEITVTAALSIASGNTASARTRTKTNIAQAASGIDCQMLQVTTGGINYTPVGIGTLGWCQITNFDATNFIEYGVSAEHSFKLQAGESAVQRLKPGTTLNLKANTATCEVEIMVGEA